MTDTQDSTHISDEKVARARKQIEQIWDRARSNAFAHRCASERYRQRAWWQYIISLLLGSVGILFVLLAFVATSYKFAFCGSWLSAIAVEMTCSQFYSLSFSLLSVLFSGVGLLFGIIQNFEQNEVRAETHNGNQHSFLYIAQRAREPRWPGLSGERVIEILTDLERDFQVLKARGQEPEDRDFRCGDDLLEELKRSSAAKRQSYSTDLQDSDVSSADHTGQ